MSEQEQNKKINEIRRQLAQAVERIKALELDMEPGGHITMGFDRLSNDIDDLERKLDESVDRLERKLDVMSNQINRVLARQEVMLEAITKINDLPEE